jgi:hypothetical protein
MTWLRAGWIGLLALVACEPDYEGKLERFQGSELPVVVIDTQGASIVDEPKRLAQLKLYTGGVEGLAQLEAGEPDFESAIGMELRGHTSQKFPKKQYGIELWDKQHDDVDRGVLEMPEESDWVLAAPFMDKSLLRNHFAYGLARSLGRYAPRTALVELFLKADAAATVGTEHYRGVYLWTEKIKRGDDRVAIEKLDDDVDSGPELEGGYLLQWTLRERVTRSERWFRSDEGAALVVEYPKPDALTELQLAWISGYVAAFERALEQPGDAYLDYLELESAVDYVLLNELLRNHDVFISSTFLSKSRTGKLALGPLWDLDRALGDVEFDGNWKTDGFLLSQRGWGKQLFKKDSFVAAYRERWRALRRDALATETMLAQIDDAVAELGSAPTRNFARWDILGTYVKANRAPYAESHAEEIDKIKTWLADRADWLDRHIDEL